jgi:hypothetical protein
MSSAVAGESCRPARLWPEATKARVQAAGSKAGPGFLDLGAGERGTELEGLGE